MYIIQLRHVSKPVKTVSHVTQLAIRFHYVTHSSNARLRFSPPHASFPPLDICPP